MKAFNIIGALFAVLFGFVCISRAEELASDAFTSNTEKSMAQEESTAEAEPTDSLIDKVIASVDGEPLTFSDLRRFMAAKGDVLPEKIDKSDSSLRMHVRDLVVDSMLQREAKESGITVGKEEVDAYVAEMKRQNNLDEEQFNQVLKSKGLTWDEYRSQIRGDILRARVVSSKVRSKISIPDEEVDRFLKENQEFLPEEGTVHLYQIMLRKESPLEGDVLKDREMIEAMRGEIEAGTEWTLAGGDHFKDLGYVDPENLREELREIVSKLKVGEVSDIIETEDSFRIVSPVSRSSEGHKLDKQAREELRNIIYQRKFKERVEKYLGEDLSEKYHVEIKLP